MHLNPYMKILNDFTHFYIYKRFNKCKLFYICVQYDYLQSFELLWHEAEYMENPARIKITNNALPIQFSITQHEYIIYIYIYIYMCVCVCVCVCCS